MMACQAGSQNKDGDTMSRADQAPPSMEESQSYDGEETNETQEIKNVDQKVIRHGSMSIKTDDALATKVEVDKIVAKHKAYTGNEHYNNTDYSAMYQLQIRVPAASLDALVADIENLDVIVTDKSINANDVTAEYIDLEARLVSKKEYLEQYKQLLKSAKNVDDLIKVREKIRVMEEEIESTVGRLKYLSNQVSFSTLELNLLQEKDYVYKTERKINFFERLKDSLSGGWYGFVEFCLLFLKIWPFWLIVILVLWIVRRYTWGKKQPPPPPGRIPNS
jgi:hypothetical protein